MCLGGQIDDDCQGGGDARGGGAIDDPTMSAGGHDAVGTGASHDAAAVARVDALAEALVADARAAARARIDAAEESTTAASVATGNAVKAPKEKKPLASFFKRV